MGATEQGGNAMMQSAEVTALHRVASRVSEAASRKVHDDEMRLRGMRHALSIVDTPADRNLSLSTTGETPGGIVRVERLRKAIEHDDILLRGMREMQAFIDGEWDEWFRSNSPVTEDEGLWVHAASRDLDEARRTPEGEVSQTIVVSAPDRATFEPPFETPADLEEAAADAVDPDRTLRLPGEEHLFPHIVRPDDA